MGGLSLVNVARDGAMWWAVVKTIDRREYAAASHRNARYQSCKQSGAHPLPTAVPLGFICPKNSLLHFSCGIPPFIGWTSTEPLKV